MIKNAGLMIKMPNKKMPNKMLKILKLSAVCCLILLCTACRHGDDVGSLYDTGTLAYDHPQNGASLTLPADWQKLSETGDSVVFADADDTVSLTLSWELGGYSYYSTDGLLDMAGSLVAAVLDDPETLASVEAGSPKDAVIFTGAGRLAASAEDAPSAICEAVVISPMSAVRYHLVAVAEVDYYAENSGLLRDIYASFHLNKTADELYQALSQNAAE